MKVFHINEKTLMQPLKPALDPWSLEQNNKVESPQCCSGLRETLEEYCTESSLHGLKYLVKSDRHVVERLFWLLAFLVSMTIAIYSIVQMYEDYVSRPLITVFESTPKRVHEIPFPAVTICNQNALSKYALQHFTSELFKKPPEAVLDEEELKTLAKISDMVGMCTAREPKSQDILELTTIKSQLYKYLDNNKEQIESLSNTFETAANVSQKCQSFIRSCFWGGHFFLSCAEYFSGVVTSFGYCCTFNEIPLTAHFTYSKVTKTERSTAHEYWEALEKSNMLNFENLISASENLQISQAFHGSDFGLKVFLREEINDTFCPHPYLDGSLVIVNTQLDFPRDNGQQIYVKGRTELSIRVKPEITLADENIKNIAIKKRKCYYGNEYKLRWHKQYTLANCMEECDVGNMIKTCNCIPKFVPYGDATLPVCKPTTGNYCNHRMNERYGAVQVLKQCDWCLPTCTEIQYNTEIPQMTDKNTNNRAMTQVNVFMDVESVYPKLRTESISIIQLLANAGGLLGLFLGFSVFSLLELLYYGTLCIRCNKGNWKTLENNTHPSQEKVVKIVGCRAKLTSIGSMEHLC